MFVINNRKIFFIISGVLVGASLLAMIIFGLPFGIDFKGGSLLEIEYTVERPEISVLEERTQELGLGDVLFQPTGERGYIIRTEKIEEENRAPLLNALSPEGQYAFEEKRFNSIGPVIGSELRTKAWFALGAVVLAIILFIAFVFRKVSEPVSSWKYGVIAIIALLHDIIIPTGIFAFLGSIFIDYQIDVLFVMALLAILGFSVNDTIVVFDRVRENLRKNRENEIKEDFEKTVGKSLEQTYTRSLNTSITTLFVLLTLLFLGGDSTQHFALTLAIGVVAGTYSSIFLASPLLVFIEQRQRRE